MPWPVQCKWHVDEHPAAYDTLTVHWPWPMPTTTDRNSPTLIMWSCLGPHQVIMIFYFALRSRIMVTEELINEPCVVNRNNNAPPLSALALTSHSSSNWAASTALFERNLDFAATRFKLSYYTWHTLTNSKDYRKFICIFAHSGLLPFSRRLK